MRPLRLFLAAACASAAVLAAAQAVPQTPTDSTKPPAAGKAEPAKPPPKKAEPKKTPPKKAPPKKADAKKAPSKPEAVAPGMTRYSNSKDAPVLRDSQGNVIPTSPDAYDVSSATGGKKK
jgi:outer membrane biosynthesis protein TonB